MKFVVLWKGNLTLSFRKMFEFLWKWKRAIFRLRISLNVCLKIFLVITKIFGPFQLLFINYNIKIKIPKDFVDYVRLIFSIFILWGVDLFFHVAIEMWSFWDLKGVILKIFLLRESWMNRLSIICGYSLIISIELMA